MRKAFYLGEWTVEPTLDRITRDGQTVRLRPRAMDVLTALAMASGEMVSKRDLIDTVWQTEFVSEHALTQVIAELRAAFGDNARNPSYIENIPRRGYRLMAPVNQIAQAKESPRDASLPFKLAGDDGDHPLIQGPNIIGRTTDADICVDSTEVSRCHARVTVQGTTATIEDLGSKNGTFVCDQMIDQPTRLCDGDVLRIGDQRFEFRSWDQEGHDATWTMQSPSATHEPHP